jgi:hypothetical protein
MFGGALAMAASAAACFRRTALATVRERDPEPALLEHMPMATRVCRSSSTIRMRRMTSSLAASDAACRRPLAREGDGLSLKRLAVFCLANQHTIAFPPQIAGLSALYRA